MASPAHRTYTIVGIDPGTTMGIAIIDLTGNLIEVFSAKHYSISDAVERIIARGNPLIIASDVTPTPTMVRKISSIFASPVHELDESLSTEEKIALTKGEGYAHKNAHERDALAACVNALRSYKKKFVQVQKKTPTGVDVEEVKALVIKGVSISAAIDRLISAREQQEKGAGEEEEGASEGAGEPERDVKTLTRLRGLLKDKEERIAILEERTASLREMVTEKERELRRVKRSLESARSVRSRELKKQEELRKRDAEIERLNEEVRAREEENADLRRIIEELKGPRDVKGGKRIKVIRTFSHDAILDTERRYGLNKGDIVFFEDGSGGGASTAELLARKGVAAVLYGKELSHFAAETFAAWQIPTFSTTELPLLLKEDEEGGFAYVDQQLLRERIEDWQRAKKGMKKVLLLR
jgi:predicted RNase H-like nuclease (RuvC/YqgF family)